MQEWILAPIGFCIALFSSLVGIGGGLLWAPFFILIKGFDFKTAIVLSFTVQILGMGSASLFNFKIKSINWRLVVGLLPIVTIGLIIGGFLNRQITNAKYLERGLGLLSIIESIFFTFQNEKYNTEMIEDKSIKAPLWLKMQGTLFSIFSGLFSIGISDFIIPVLRGKLKIPMRNSIGTSIFLNFYSACIGAAVSFFFYGSTLPPDTMSILLYCWIGVVLGGQIGPKLSSFVGDNRLKEIFIFVLMLVGIHLIFQSL